MINKINYYLIPLLLILFSSQISFAENIHVYSYHGHPPFVIEKGKGMSYDLVDLMNKKAEDSLKFTLEVIPRSRLNMVLSDWIDGKCMEENSSCRKDWTVIWVNPAWGFGKSPESKYLWVKILNDSNSIISLNNKKIEYKNPDSLKGLKFGGMRGHRYVGIDELARKNQLIRIDGNKEQDNILKLVLNRVDVILLPTSTIKYFLSNVDDISKYKNQIYVAPTKHQIFSRNFMIPLRKDIRDYVNSSVLPSKEWQDILTKYGF